MAKRRKQRPATARRPVSSLVIIGLLAVTFITAGLIWGVSQPDPSPATPGTTPSSVVSPTLLLTPTTPVTEPPATATATQPLTPTVAGAAPGPAAGQSPTTPVYSYRIINSYPHDPGAFTQGLIYEDGIFYEGTGLWGQSTLRRVEPETGTVTQLYALPKQYFGEGITSFGDRLIQLTWQSNVGFVYDKESFELLQQFNYPTEGWGLTHNGEYLLMSDGTANLYFLNPTTFERVRQVEVRDQGQPVPLLNELEYIDGEVYANIWKTDRIARIAPDTGQVTAWIDLSGLLKPEDVVQPVDVLNGIAYDAENERLFVTGKWWPKLFEIELVPAE